ncbi:MAG: tetraacyldisaccharide 4'-kinase [Candidatus Omnitrophica bacterium]|nr:tetraacyldisaccharide 4'-kinase [Candidatus Omnitrophota bacterium]
MNKFLHDVVTGQNRGPAALALKPLLWVLSLLYAFGVACRRWAYFAGIRKSYSTGVPVISVGNITAGGTGKTPFTIYLAQKIAAAGKRPAILMRGYMSESGAVSDEAEMLRRKLIDVPVLVSPDRVRSARESLFRDGPDVFILDDGFQHWKIRRDLDIVILDLVNPFGNGGLLPFGILRESKSQLKRADLLVLNRADMAPDRIPAMYRELRKINPRAGIVESAQAPIAVEELSWEEGTLGEVDPGLVSGSICACSAIGSPEGFAVTLRAMGAELVHHEIFIDHHVYTADDVQKMLDVCRLRKVDRLVTTQKDIVKLLPFREMFRDIRLMAVVIAVQVLKGENEINLRLNSLLHS